jgi:hypothetical protein
MNVPVDLPRDDTRLRQVPEEPEDALHGDQRFVDVEERRYGFPGIWFVVRAAPA